MASRYVYSPNLFSELCRILFGAETHYSAYFLPRTSPTPPIQAIIALVPATEEATTL